MSKVWWHCTEGLGFPSPRGRFRRRGLPRLQEAVWICKPVIGSWCCFNQIGIHPSPVMCDSLLGKWKPGLQAAFMDTVDMLCLQSLPRLAKVTDPHHSNCSCGNKFLIGNLQYISSVMNRRVWGEASFSSLLPDLGGERRMEDWLHRRNAKDRMSNN